MQGYIVALDLRQILAFATSVHLLSWPCLVFLFHSRGLCFSSLTSTFPSMEEFIRLIICSLISSIPVGQLLIKVPLVLLAKGREMGISLVESVWLLSYVWSL